MKKIKFILPTLVLGLTPLSVFSIVNCNNPTNCTITFNGGEHGQVSSTQTVQKGTKWSLVEKPIINADWGYVFTGWKDASGNDLNDSTTINSSLKAIAQYRDIQSGEQFTKSADTLVSYATKMNFYTPSEYYQSSSCVLLDHEAYNEYTFTIDTSIATDGIRYFWISKSISTFAVFDKDIFIKSIKCDGSDVQFHYSSASGTNKAYITFDQAYTTRTITLQLKFSSKVKGIPCFEINEY